MILKRVDDFAKADAVRSNSIRTMNEWILSSSTY